MHALRTRLITSLAVMALLAFAVAPALAIMPPGKSDTRPEHWPQVQEQQKASWELLKELQEERQKIDLQMTKINELLTELKQQMGKNEDH